MGNVSLQLVAGSSLEGSLYCGAYGSIFGEFLEAVEQ